MKNTSSDYLNFGLLIVSFYIAIKIPFELFLFSYAFFGPLHYLTEINWLNDKRFFIKASKKWVLFYSVLAFAIALYPVLLFLDFSFESVFKSKLKYIGAINNMLLIIGFLFAISLVVFTKNKQLLIALGLCVIASFTLYFFVPDILIFTGIFLPTLIHVYIFTLLFMIYGLTKSKTKLGFINIVILIIVPILIIFIEIIPKLYNPSEFIKGTYIDSNLLGLNTAFSRIFSSIESDKFNVLSKLGIKIQIFIAFSYTYHYLNWFSKTSIIGWGKSINKDKLKYILIFWICSIAIYLYDYKTGLITLFFLSFLHVFLEFPLNITTIKSLFKYKK